MQQQILTFGTGAVTLLAGTAFVGLEADLRSSVLVIFVPLLAYLVLTLWFTEVMGMLRLGAFLLLLEKRLDTLGDGSLAWEATVYAGRVRRSREQPAGVERSAKPPNSDMIRTLAIIGLFLTIAATSIVLGWGKAPDHERAIAIVSGLMALVVLFALWRLRIQQLYQLLNVRPLSWRARWREKIFVQTKTN